MVKLSFSRIFWAGILFAVVGQVVNILGSFLTMSYYLTPEYFPVWSKIMMPAAGPPPSSFFVYSAVFAIVSGILIALVYAVLKDSVPGSSAIKKGLFYGLLVFLVGAVPGYLMLVLLINIPLVLVLSWALGSLIIDLVGGMVIAKIVR